MTTETRTKTPTPEEITKLQDGARLLGQVLTGISRTLEAARLN